MLKNINIALCKLHEIVSVSKFDVESAHSLYVVLFVYSNANFDD